MKIFSEDAKQLAVDIGRKIYYVGSVARKEPNDMKMPQPDKVIEMKLQGRRFSVHLFAKQNIGYLFDWSHSTEEPVFKYSPVNSLTVLDIHNVFRKPVRYILRIERDLDRLKEEGFTPLGATPVPYPITGARREVKKKEEPERKFSAKWL